MNFCGIELRLLDKIELLQRVLMKLFLFPKIDAFRDSEQDEERDGEEEAINGGVLLREPVDDRGHEQQNCCCT